MFVYTIWDILILGIIGIIVIGSIIYATIKNICDIGKKNCYECKYYKLDDVASCGDCCWYKCSKHNRKDNGVSMNERVHLERCKDFEEVKNK
jgi:hypothetical protein